MGKGAARSAEAGWVRYVVLLLVVAALTLGLLAVLDRISERKREAPSPTFRIVGLGEETVDPAEWGKNFPHQYDAYLRTVDTARTRHGGSEAFQKLDEDPLWRELFAGYPFGIDYREERGHAYMLLDQRATERVTRGKQPGACLHCHASILPVYREVGRDHDAPGSADLPLDSPEGRAQLMKGFEVVCAMPYEEATKLVEHPVACLDCHDPSTMKLRVTRPAFLNGVAALAESGDALPHLRSIERWRAGERVAPYDANRSASRQEMRSLVCAQCHTEYYLTGDANLLVYPWQGGLLAQSIEASYDEAGHTDWTHLVSRAPLLKAQHPEFQLWSQGIHARSGVACADCHMPTLREGALEVSDHHVRSPLLNVARACQTCHELSEEELIDRVEGIQDKTQALMLRAEKATVSLIDAIRDAADAGLGDDELFPARDFHRKAHWRLDFVASENSMGFHAPQEAARLLAEAIDYARQGEIRVHEARGGS